MTASKVLILLAALVIVLFGISLAFSSRNRNQQTVPQSSRLNMLVRPQKFDLSEVSPTNGWQNGRWLIANGATAAVLDIGPSKIHRKIRRLQLGLEGSATFQVEFIPRPAKDKPGEYADAEAIPIKIKSLQPNQRAIELTILEHGGTLVVHRSSPFGAAVFKVQ